MAEEEQDDRLGSALADLWRRNERRGFYRRAVAEGVPIIQRVVMRELGMPLEDAEDCVGAAFEAFYAREDESGLSNPFAYLTTSALNAGRTLYRRRKREAREQLEAMGNAGAGTTMSAEWAVMAVEEALGDVEAEESWAVEVLEFAMEKLGPRQREVVGYLAGQDFDFERGDLGGRSAAAAAALGMRPPAFRKAKERAYARLKVEIPAAVQSLGVKAPSRFVDAFEESRGSFMEDGDGG